MDAAGALTNSTSESRTTSHNREIPEISLVERRESGYTEKPQVGWTRG
jgi:hypothetical protein